ncbi:Drought induced 19 protein type zinc-binding domain [Arabidopsis thaliana x Arabidopsis arenosa]|uniref:Protein DEHYDRATION-INDUCED 19 homolog 4 n=3 Tax=Arabidopsis TaxID=3701 RepID=DI194_ARATH|nr:Drought-responsive family protein [Arabidopsis thaliana]Q8VXU6.1 RecName: Full=Protein DEHYDRATION-INDUCED 19 homolog 4; Short=AtDi19-4 [Arabidopsis thaliana]KAG7624309.1 Drought induced 19 protein type zinc-binding domain [Arabidopsis thaliana x Arabidopsis arenosa]KAG7630325.1 Drought induced 19 protein type zinc-binding domain [Arabidopsis suecica]AAL67123.1 AT3g06760/F3E22_10 [Arabidopsis thaliana]AAM91471.1 AT3g06760/F3E22_10 [Arabidopsis thaliana]AEE74452.1 Drought-responsive family |eukprot:NP_187332.2 Drought-responsive family protein [Arabidopsis thaliana]
MDSNWINCPSVFSSSSSSSRRCQSRSDLYLGGGYEDLEGEDDLKAEFICPFCAEDFDIVGLCCHIDEEHPVEAKNGVCPVCTKRVGLDIVGHITTQHANFFKVQRRRRLRRGGYSSTYLALKKELREANLQSLLGGSSSFTSSTNIDSDPLLSSFMFNSPSVNQSANKSATPVTVGNAATKVSIKESLKRDIQEAPLSGEDQEKAKKSEFVRGLLLSTMLEDDF